MRRSRRRLEGARGSGLARARACSPRNSRTLHGAAARASGTSSPLRIPDRIGPTQALLQLRDQNGIGVIFYP
jgi:hypothetical protein